MVDVAGNEMEYRLPILQKLEVTGDYTGVTGETPDAIYCTEYHTTISAD